MVRFGGKIDVIYGPEGEESEAPGCGEINVYMAVSLARKSDPWDGGRRYQDYNATLPSYFA